MIVNLIQAELDDAYHLAYCECEAAATDAIRRCFRLDDERTQRDLVINRVCEALHEVEVKHMGAERYASLLERLIERGKELRA
jgi:hypothetical protein